MANATPAPLRSQNPNPLSYIQHHTTLMSSVFNLRQPPPIFNLPRLSVPNSAPSSLTALKRIPSSPAQPSLTWNKPIISDSVDARSLQEATLTPIFTPAPKSSLACDPRPFQPPSMSLQNSSGSQSFQDMCSHVHNDGSVSPPVSRPSTSLSQRPSQIRTSVSSSPGPSPSLSVIHPPSTPSQQPSPVATPPSPLLTPSLCTGRPSISLSHPSPSTLRPMLSIADLMSHETPKDISPVNPVLQGAENNWALAEKSDLVTTSNPSLGEGERQLKSRTTDSTIARACAELLSKHDTEWLELAKKNGWSIERVRRAREIRARVNQTQDPSPYQAALFYMARILNDGTCFLWPFITLILLNLIRSPSRSKAQVAGASRTSEE